MCAAMLVSVYTSSVLRAFATQLLAAACCFVFRGVYSVAAIQLSGQFHPFGLFWTIWPKAAAGRGSDVGDLLVSQDVEI